MGLDLLYWKKMVYLVCMAIIVVGAFVWGILGVGGPNVVEAVLGRKVARWIYVAVGVAALVVGFRRDTYLPFLGETVLPCSMMQERVPEHADTEMTVGGLTPGAKVLFWATEPATEGLARIKDWRQAYLDFSNAGVTTANEAGMAVLHVRRPQPYTVPLKGAVPAHVHWRVCGDGGFLGPVQTISIDGGGI